MKLSIFTAIAALLFGIAGSAQAVEPFATAYGAWGTTSSYYVPTSSVYGVTPSYNSYGYSTYPGYATYPSYSTYPQFGTTWNASSYQTPTYTYDPVHGDYHINRSAQSPNYTYDPVHGDYHANNNSSLNTWNGGCSNGARFRQGYGQQNGYRW
jgi:hypothetical protein